MKHTNKIKVFATYYFVICYLFGFSQSPSFQWAKKFGGSSNKEGNSVTIDGLGNVYTTGYFEGTTDFDPGVGVFNLTSSGSSTNIFVCKLDAAGNFLWARNFGSSSFDTGTNIKCDQNNNVVVAGNFRGTVDFDPTAATFTMASSGLSDDDVFILKLDPNGNLVWAKQFAGGGSFVNPNDLKIDPFNNVIVFGEYRGIIDLDPGAGTFFLSSQTWYSNAYLCKLNSAGNFVWGGQYTGLNNTGDNRGNSVDIDASGNIYTTGQFVFSSVVDFNMGPATSTLVSNFYGSTYICKQDANGNFLWVKQFLGSGANNPFGIKVNTNSEIIISGEASNTFGVIDFDPGIGTFTLNT